MQLTHGLTQEHMTGDLIQEQQESLIYEHVQRNLMTLSSQDTRVAGITEEPEPVQILGSYTSQDTETAGITSKPMLGFTESPSGTTNSAVITSTVSPACLLTAPADSHVFRYSTASSLPWEAYNTQTAIAGFSQPGLKSHFDVLTSTVGTSNSEATSNSHMSSSEVNEPPLPWKYGLYTQITAELPNVTPPLPRRKGRASTVVLMTTDTVDTSAAFAACARLATKDVPTAGLLMDDQITIAGVPSGDLLTAGVPTAGVPTEYLPMAGVPTEDLPTAGVPTEDLPTTGVPTEDLPMACVRTEDLLMAGVPTEDLPTASEDLPMACVPTEDLLTAGVTIADMPTGDLLTTDVSTEDLFMAGVPTIPMAGVLIADVLTAVPIADLSMADVPAEDLPMAGVPTEDSPMAGVPTEDLPMAGVPTEDLPMAGVPTEDLPMAGVPTEDLPMSGVPTEDLPVAGVHTPMAGVPTEDLPVAGVHTPMTGVPTEDLPVAGVPTEDLPVAGVPTEDLPMAGIPIAGVCTGVHIPTKGVPMASVSVSLISQAAKS